MHDAAQSQQSSAKAHRPSTPTVFGAAFVAGAVAAFGINSFFDAHVARTRPQVESEPIFVALRSLPQGAPVTVWDVGLRAWPRAMLPETALRAEDRFEGLILRHPLREGQPLLSVQLAQPVAAGDTPGGARVEEAFAAPVPAADATPAPTPTAGPTPAESGLATIAPPAPDDVEVFAAVERFEPATPAAGSAREPAPAIEPLAATPAPVAQPVFAPVAQPTIEPVVTPVEPPAVASAEDLATTAPVAPAQPGATAAEPADGVETPAPPVATGEPAVTPSDTVAVPPADASVDATVPQPLVTADAGGAFLATIGAPAADVRSSPEAVDAPPLLPATGADGPAESLAEAPVAPPADPPARALDGLSEGDETGLFGPPRRTPTAAAEPVVTDAPLVPTPVLPLPAVEATVRAAPTRPLVPPTPGSDIEGSLATISRQRAAQIAANRPGSVIAAADPLVPEPAPVPALPTADVAVPLASIAAIRAPAPRSPAPPTRLAQAAPSTGLGATSSTATAAPTQTIPPVVPQAAAPTGPATTPAPLTAGLVGTPDTEAVGEREPAAVVSEAPPAHPPLRHLVVPERIAMQAEASFVATRPAPSDEPTADVPSAATAPVAAGKAGAAPRVTNGATKGAMNGPTTEPRGDRAAASTTQPRPAQPSRSTSGPVMRAIGSLFQGFSGQTSTEQSRRR